MRRHDFFLRRILNFVIHGDVFPQIYHRYSQGLISVIEILLNSSIIMTCRDVSTLPLAPSIIGILQHAGFQHTSDLHGLQPTELSQELKISIETALMILKCVTGTDNDNIIDQNVDPKATSNKVFTAKDMIEKAIALKPIITYSQSMDAMMGGGVCIGQLTEFCGPPGVGKTQICIQLCIDVQLPRLLNGVEGEAVYIDTEGR